MDQMLSGLAGGLLVLLVGWLVAKYYNRSRLYCALSRLYEYSHLVDGGSTVQLVLANRGRKPEEAVEVQLSNEYEYHLLATTQNGIEIPKEKVIRIPVLLPKSEVSLIFVAEGKPRFSKDGIRYIRSKTANGIVGASLTEAEASTPGAIVTAVALLLVVAVFGYGMGRTVGEDLWRWGERKILSSNAQKFTEGCVTADSNLTADDIKNGLTEEKLKTFALAAVRVKQVATQGDMLFLDVEVDNAIKGPVEYSLKLRSHASDSSVDYRLRGNSYVYDIIMLDAGEKRNYSLSTAFPESRSPKRFWLEVRIEVGGYWISTKRAFFFGSDAEMSCPAL